MRGLRMADHVIDAPSHEESAMTTVHIRQSTTVSLNRFVAALINFGPGRGRSSRTATGTGSESTSAATPGLT